MQKIYILESMPLIADKFVKALSGNYKIEVCRDTRKALSDLERFRPDLLVIDLSVPSFDAFELLNTAFMAGIRPKILASVQHGCAVAEARMSRYGASCLLTRPVTAENLAKNAEDILLELEEDDEDAELRRIANDLLLKLGLRIDLQGYRYALVAVLYACKHMDCTMTGELYPEVAARCGGNAQQVERAIRSCIQKAWFKRDDQIWNMYFPKDNNGRTLHLTNGAFLKRIAFAVNDFYIFIKGKKTDSNGK